MLDRKNLNKKQHNKMFNIFFTSNHVNLFIMKTCLCSKLIITLIITILII